MLAARFELPKRHRGDERGEASEAPRTVTLTEPDTATLGLTMLLRKGGEKEAASEREDDPVRNVDTTAHPRSRPNTSLAVTEVSETQVEAADPVEPIATKALQEERRP